MYVDGEMAASSNANWKNDPGFATFSIGGQGGTLTTNGMIDELAIYDYVITDEYVNERFKAVTPLGEKVAVEVTYKLTTTWGGLKSLNQNRKKVL